MSREEEIIALLKEIRDIQRERLNETKKLSFVQRVALLMAVALGLYVLWPVASRIFGG